MRSKIFYIFCFCFFFFNANAAQINLSVDKDNLTEGDTLFLSVSYDGEDSDSLDLSSLDKDFRIVSNSSSQQFSFVNGDVSREKKWILGLQPLRTGKITINPIRMGNILSNSITINVDEATSVAYAPDVRENSNSPFFKITQSVDNDNPYVQQQLLLLVQVYDSIGIQNGTLSVDEKTKNDWILIPLLNQPHVEQQVVNQRQMNVLTYAYAAFPQKSGKYLTPQITFDGFYVKNSNFGFPNINDDFAMFGVNFRNIFGQNVPVKLKTDTKEINVQPIPSDFKGRFWLPLSDLRLSATWSAKKGFKVGEAVNRTITLTATGVAENMLPPINFKDAAGIKQYPEKPEATEKVINGKIVTEAKINNVYIPTQSGNITVPAIEVEWFNVNTNKVEKTIISEEEIIVLPNSELENIADTQHEPSYPNTNLEEQKIEKKENTPTQSFNLLTKNNLQFFIYGFVGVCVLLLVLFLFSSKKKTHKYRDAVIKEIKRHDYKQAKESLLAWANAKFYPANIKNFNDINQLLQNDAFEEQLSLFNRFLYSTNEEYFDVAKFVEIFKKVDKIQRKGTKKDEVLPNLYD